MVLTNAEAVRIQPINAWLLLGDDKAIQRRDPRFPHIPGRLPDSFWTASPNIQPGDLLFVYFMAPHKRIKYVARAASRAEFRNDADIRSNRPLNQRQRVVWVTPLIAVPEISLAELREICGGNLYLRGQSGKYLSRSQASEIITRMRERETLTKVQSSLLQVPRGLDAEREAPARDFGTWRDLASGQFLAEKNVEDLVVAPLLSLLAQRDPSITHERQRRLPGAGVPDYVLNRGDDAVCVVEAKRGIIEPSHSWRKSPEMKQVRRYMDSLGVPGILIDAGQVLLVAPGATKPSLMLDRASMVESDLDLILDHINGNARPN